METLESQRPKYFAIIVIRGRRRTLNALQHNGYNKLTLTNYIAKGPMACYFMEALI